jgi:hypothetical protein
MYLDPDKLVSMFESCRGDRSNFETLWQDLTDYLIPRKSDIQKTSSPGEQKGVNILDATGMNSAELLASSLHGMLTSPVSLFFGLTTGDIKLDNNDQVRLWVQDTVRRMHDCMNNSNFQTEAHEYYLDLVTCGGSPLFVEEDLEDIVRFTSWPLREVYIKENSKGRIDTFYRDFQLDCRGLVDEFGLDNLPQNIQEEFKNGKHNKYEVLHSVYPRDVAGYGVQSPFKFLSQYVLKKDKTNLSVKGFREFPLVYGRWSKIAGESYGRGPGEKALPEVKTLNKMTETVIRGAQKVVDPPLQAPDDGFIMPLVTKPGGFNYYRAGSKDRIETVFNDSRIDFGYQAMDRKMAAIREAFYIDQMKLREGPQMTATEVSQRVEEALRFMAPMLGRQQTEFLGPLVGRVYAIMERRGKLQPVPPQLNGVPLQIQYSSVMAASQRMSEMSSISKFFNGIAPLSSIDASAVDNIDVDAGVKYIARLTNLPQEMVRGQEDIQKIRDDRAKAQQEQANMVRSSEQAKNASTVVDAASKFKQA